MKPFITMLLGVVGLLAGLGFVMPASAPGALPVVSVVLLGLGLLIAAAGLFAGRSGLRRLKS